MTNKTKNRIWSLLGITISFGLLVLGYKTKTQCDDSSLVFLAGVIGTFSFFRLFKN